MTKSDFVDKVADTSGLSKKDAGAAVDAVIKSIEDALRPVRRSRSRASASSTSPSAARVRVATRARARRCRSPPARSRASRPAPASRRPSSSGRRATLCRPPAKRRPPSRSETASRRRSPNGSPRSSWASIPTRRKLWPDAVEGLAESRARLAMALADVERSAALDLGQGGRAPRLEAAAAVLGHCLALIDAAGPACVAVKPQLACFERLGFPGWLALEAIIAHARAHGLLVIADAKRGDIAASAAAYGQALFGGLDTPFGPSHGLGADAVTANPLLGADALAPLIEAARAPRAPACSCSCAPRTRAPPTSSTSSWPPAARCGSGSPAWSPPPARRGPSPGLAEVGAVTGATVPEHLARMRELMPHTPFLLPGIGAQGGEVADLAPAFAPGPRRRAWSAPRARSPTPTRRPAAARRRRHGRRPSGCASRPGRWPERHAAPRIRRRRRVSSAPMAGRSPARFIAPLALVAFALALFIVVSTPPRTTRDAGAQDAAQPAQTTATPTTARRRSASARAPTRSRRATRPRASRRR